MLHIQMSHVANMSASCDTYAWVKFHVLMSYVARINESYIYISMSVIYIYIYICMLYTCLYLCMLYICIFIRNPIRHHLRAQTLVDTHVLIYIIICILYIYITYICYIYLCMLYI